MGTFAHAASASHGGDRACPERATTFAQCGEVLPSCLRDRTIGMSQLHALALGGRERRCRA